MRKILELLFWGCLAAFLVLGAVVVFGQILGVLASSGAIVKGVSDRFSDLAFALSTACAAAAFGLRYTELGEGKD